MQVMEVCSRLLLGQRWISHPLVYRYVQYNTIPCMGLPLLCARRAQRSAAFSSAVREDLPVSDSSTELDYSTDDSEDEDLALKPDRRRRKEASLPPSSHESPSLLYDPQARSEFRLLRS